MQIDAKKIAVQTGCVQEVDSHFGGLFNAGLFVNGHGISSSHLVARDKDRVYKQTIYKQKI
jgi:hypothetical protein